MKKKLAALLCGVMCVGDFTGCSSTELAYLKMSKDMMDTMESCKVEGTMQAEVDLQGMQEFMNCVAEATYGEFGAEESDVEMPSGKKTVLVDYDMNMNMDTLAYDMSFDVTYEGRAYDLGTMYYSMTDGVYVTTDTLWGVYQMAGELMEGYEYSYIFSDSFAKDFQKILAEDEYVELVSTDYLTGVDVGSVLPESSMNDLYDAVFTFYEDVLDGFETGMVKQINGGYAIKADGQEVAQLLVDLLDFVAENPEQIIDATEAYMTVVMDSAMAGSPEEAAAVQEELAAMFEQARASQADFVDAAAQMSAILADTIQEPGVAAVLDAFSYDAKVKKNGNGFDSTAAYTITNKGKQVLSLTTDAVMKESDVKVTMPNGGMTVDELNEKLAVLENTKYNPVTGVSVTWGMYGETDYADLYAMRSVAEGTYFSSNYNWSELIVEDGRAYLPLRAICDLLKEEVGWENSTKTPYVVKDGERMDMKGKLQDGRAFVGVRDFEKLGYTVTYTSHKDAYDDMCNYKEVVIEK